MGMTRSEHILARSSGKARVAPGDMVVGKADVIMGNDITTSLTVRILDANGITQFADPDKVFIVMSHFVPAKDIASAAMAKTCRDFARKYNIKHYFEAGQGGIEHALLPDEGYVVPGDLVLGADSHSCTYGGVNTFATGIGSTDLAAAWTTGELWLRVPETIKIVFNGVPKSPWVSAKDVVLFLISQLGDDGALYQAQEFHGEGTQHLSVEGRLTIANMAIEGGAKNSIFPCDDKTLAYEAGRAKRDFQGVEADADATYAAVHEFDISNLEPQVAFPHLPSNCKPVSQAMQEKVAIDQVFIDGSCTNAKLEDLRMRPLRGQNPRRPPARQMDARRRHPGQPQHLHAGPGRRADQHLRQSRLCCRRGHLWSLPARLLPATWASSGRASGCCPRPTATSRAAPATCAARPTWRHRRWPPPRRLPASLRTPARWTPATADTAAALTQFTE